MQYKTCTHVYDNGNFCQSAAAKDLDFCVFHLRYRARQLRMAQARARSQRFDLKLPPLESMSTVLSAVNQLVEAVAADMLDLKRAEFLLKSLRFAAQALKSSDKWQPSVFHTDVVAPAVDVAAEYGLPHDLDLNTPPEVAFPPPEPVPVGAPPLSPSFGDRVGDAGGGDFYEAAKLAVENAFEPFEFKPQDIELTELYNTQGLKAMESRAREHQYNERRRKQRKLFRANYERYIAEAKARNIQRAAEKLVAEKLAAEKAPASQARSDQPEMKKPPTTAGAGEGFMAKEDAIA